MTSDQKDMCFQNTTDQPFEIPYGITQLCSPPARSDNVAFPNYHPYRQTGISTEIVVSHTTAVEFKSPSEAKLYKFINLSPKDGNEIQKGVSPSGDSKAGRKLRRELQKIIALRQEPKAGQKTRNQVQEGSTPSKGGKAAKIKGKEKRAYKEKFVRLLLEESEAK